MKITSIHDILTRDDQETFDAEELHGMDAPHAYHINYFNKGFAKFKFDAKSLKVFENDLHKVESSMSRKQIFNIMYDMLKTNDLSGAQLLQICKSQLVSETATDVLGDVLRFVVPSVIKSYIPLENYESSHHDIFECFLNVLSSGKIVDKSTQHLILDAVLTSARNEDHIKDIVKWFETGFVHDTKGNKMAEHEVSLKHKHSIIKRVYSSIEMKTEDKEALFKQLEALDKSDWITDSK